MQGSVRQLLARGFCLLALSSLACQHDPAVLIHLRNGDLVRVPVELAMTPEARARGLMYRHDLPPDAGMLFVFPETETQAFWMKNTPLPLDMIFIDERFRIVGLVEHAVPFSTSPLGPGRPSRYVLEVNAGFATRHHIRAGDRVEFRHVPSSSS